MSAQWVQTPVSKLSEWGRAIDFIVPVLVRVYLAFIFIPAGWGKLSALENTAYYFGEFLGLPLPGLMALLAGVTEFVGGCALLIGFAVRVWAVPLAFTMLVAALSAHWQNGWHVLPEATLTVPWEWRTDLIEGAQVRKEAMVSLLQTHGNYGWLTETGSVTILKNGIEFAATYLLLCLVLLYTGAGRYLSVDYWLGRRFPLF